MRARNRDPLASRFAPEQRSYWIVRDGEAGGMENQF
jgi:hypothetical protein